MGLELRDISFSYGRDYVLKGVDMNVDDGEIYALLGGSGSGKTTLLSIVAGFLEPSKGKVVLNGTDITRTVIEKRRVGVVFQDYALFPHMSVGSNIEYPMEARNIPSRDRKRRLKELLALVSLEGYEKRYPSELSGGEKQRTSLARTLASEPSLILLDEPLSALDASLRDGLRRELRVILKDSGIPTIHVTHDQTEAVSISDRMGLLHGGRIIEEGGPEDLFRRPKYLETARFMGFRNIFKVKEGTRGHLITPLGSIPWSGKVPGHVAFRSDSAVVSGEGSNFSGMVLGKELRGNRISIIVEVSGFKVEIEIPTDIKAEVGRPFSFIIPNDDMIPLFP